MKALVIRKNPKRFSKLKEKRALKSKDLEIEILYVKSLKKARKTAKSAEYDFVFSLDFKEFNKKAESIMCYFPQKALKKTMSRHGINLDEKPLGIEIEKLNDKNKEILVKMALCVKYMTIYTHFNAEEFDFLVEEAGICPRVINSKDVKEEIAVFLGEEFLIKIISGGKTYYDIKLKLPEGLDEYNLPEAHRIFWEYIKANPDKAEDVKIRELMSK